MPEQVMAFEVTMTDALTNQLGKQMIQRQQLIFWRITALNVRRKTLDDVRPRQVFSHQVRPTAQPQKPLLQHRQRLGRSNPQKRQTVAFAPRMPGAARAPEALEPMGETLDVVALDHQRPTAHLDLA